MSEEHTLCRARTHRYVRDSGRVNLPLRGHKQTIGDDGGMVGDKEVVHMGQPAGMRPSKDSSTALIQVTVHSPWICNSRISSVGNERVGAGGE